MTDQFTRRGQLVASARRILDSAMVDRLVNRAAVVVAASAVWLAVNYSGQLSDLKSTIYGRCEQRQAYDRSNHASVVADVRLYTEILHLQEQTPVPTDPRRRLLALRYRDAITSALTSKQAAAEQGLIGSCASFR